ncbi:hypothetical protein XENTR_v10020551 [Xenopus tropicalis]|nr:hypothetical protein XENTR_v10020551 [Xenopus tropicalis]
MEWKGMQLSLVASWHPCVCCHISVCLTSSASHCIPPFLSLKLHQQCHPLHSPPVPPVPLVSIRYGTIKKSAGKYCKIIHSTQTDIQSTQTRIHSTQTHYNHYRNLHF